MKKSMTFGKKPSVSEMAKTAEDRRGGRPVKTKDIAPPSKAKVSLKGTNPAKGKVAITIKKNL